jgi:type III restriction enzyme
VAVGVVKDAAFAEFAEVYQIEADFEAKVAEQFGKMLDAVAAVPTATAA